MVVLDTHALLWWALDPDRLSQVAVDVVAQVEREGGFASAISILELGVKVQRGKLELGLSIERFAHRIETQSPVELLAVDSTTWLRALALDWDHRDPADRVIVATALLRGVPVLTRDDAIRSFNGIETIW